MFYNIPTVLSIIKDIQTVNNHKKTKITVASKYCFDIYVSFERLGVENDNNEDEYTYLVIYKQILYYRKNRLYVIIKNPLLIQLVLWFVVMSCKTWNQNILNLPSIVKNADSDQWFLSKAC